MILGVDFTSAPRRAKPITVARGALRDGALVVERVDALPGWEAFEALLRTPGPWVGGFDFPFGLPRELVAALGWPQRWDALVRHYAALPRHAVDRVFADWRAARPVGRKYAHRACDAHSGASPSMKLVNPPVAWMLHEGAPRLLDAGVHLPGLHAGDRQRVALEAYPGRLVRQIADRAGVHIASYKNDARAKQTPERRAARRFIVAALLRGEHLLSVPALMRQGLRRAAVDDPTGDTLDAIACAVQAAWAAQRAAAGYGLPADVDPLEGWIVSA